MESGREAGLSQLLPGRHLQNHLVQFLLVPRPHGSQNTIWGALVSSKLLAVCTRHSDISHLSFPGSGSLFPLQLIFLRVVYVSQTDITSDHRGCAGTLMGCGGSKVSQWSGFYPSVIYLE
jgi:hypothetical protein